MKRSILVKAAKDKCDALGKPEWVYKEIVHAIDENIIDAFSTVDYFIANLEKWKLEEEEKKK